MDRVAAMLVLLALLVSASLLFLAVFTTAPIFSSCIVSLLYSLYVFLTNESSGVHHAQEFENRFWTIFAVLFSTVFFFAKDSPIAFGRTNPTLGFFCIVVFGYAMHAWDRYVHRLEISKHVNIRRGTSATSSLTRLHQLGIPIEEKLTKINSCLDDIDQLLLPSTINNFINQRFVLRKEKEIITIFEEAEPKALNYLVSHVKLGLLFYKIKDHRNFSGQHRTELIELLAVDRISVLSVISRVIVLHSLMIMKLPANSRSEFWVRNIILSTHQDDLSELKTLTDSKGDYFCMNKLLYDDIRSETVRQDILTHIRKEASIQEAHMTMGTKKAKLRRKKAWRKVLSDVDDTLTSSGGSYPAGIDKRYKKKVVYPGVLAFYREIDLGTQGAAEWPNNTVGNLVFLSARPHLYKDVSERHNFAKFQKLRDRGKEDIRRGMHTIPSLLAGDVSSGTEFIVKDNMEPLALKKFNNFQRYVSIYPEFKHVFVCDNGQGDVRAGELMFDAFPKHLEAMYVHRVQDVHKTHGYNAERYARKQFQPCFFRTYPEAALDAASRTPPFIRVEGLQRVCQDAVTDFYMIQIKDWPSLQQKAERREELNQAIWKANQYLESCGVETVQPIEAERIWKDGQMVKTPYGIGTVRSFDSALDLYEVELDWRPLDVQVAEHKEREAKKQTVDSSPLLPRGNTTSTIEGGATALETVMEASEEIDDTIDGSSNKSDADASPRAGEIDPTGVADARSVLPGEVSQNTSPLRQPSIVSEESSVDTSAAGDTQSVSSAGQLADTTESSTRESSMPSHISTTLEDTKGIQSKKTRETASHPVIAKIQGRLISKYSPPKLPVPPKESRSIFSFWTAESSKAKGEEFTPGDKCTTPFGPATVVEYRKAKKMVVVKMIGWSAKAYLEQGCVTKVVSEGIWNSLLRTLHRADKKDAVSRDKARKELEFPHAIGTIVQTPYGEGVVTRPIPVPKEEKSPPKSSKKAVVKTEMADSKSRDVAQGEAPTSPKRIPPHQLQETQTVGINLTSWVLADESSPMLYCTVETAKEWKNAKDDKSKGDTILSVVGSLMSRGLKRMTSSVEKVPKPSDDTKKKPPMHERYYQDGASVATSYGDGVVRTFRETDGFYEVSLINWKMKGGVRPVAYLRRDDLSYRLAKGCKEGYPVLTSLGLSGTLASVEPTTGVHVVTIPSVKMVCYLQPKDVWCPLKASVGEDVATPYGEGEVRRYRKSDDMYEIALNGSGATLYCRGETFDRIADGMKDSGSTGLSSILRYLFFSADEKFAEGGSSHTRSRSNSIGSVSGKSVSSVSSVR